MTQDQKDLLQSKTFWGLIISGAAAILLHFGITVDQTALVNDAVVVAGLVFSAYGRLVAKKPVTSAFGLTTKKAADKSKAEQGNA